MAAFRTGAGGIGDWRATPLGDDRQAVASCARAGREQARRGTRTLGILEHELAARPFLAGDTYTIADMAVFAYASRAREAGLSLDAYPHFRAWIARVEAQPDFLAAMHPYAIDPHSVNELP
ncbi:glutathione binding-like protein [Rhodanobacter sp. C01]|uniref:glutathione binding-like protein n=1 Tax=Rhodanobacter sp. C01 TaxID=1945856 RepID=UPI0020C43576|nr:glutathione binding-like protein [Rhodanobacter sp. C01]